MSRTRLFKRSHGTNFGDEILDADDDSDYDIENDLIVPVKRSLTQEIGDDAISTTSNETSDQNYHQQQDSSRSPPLPSSRSSQPKYEYLKLENVLSLYPITDKKYVHIHAVIVYYDKHKRILVVMDETCKKIDIHIGKDAEFERLPLIPGDIVRIHRLCLLKDLNLRCTHAKNVVIFQSFKENLFSPFYLSKNPTITDYDRLRVTSLNEFNRQFLFSVELQKDENKSYWICDTVFQVLCTMPIKSRYVIACWNGKPLHKFPCWNSIDIEEIVGSISKVNTSIATNHIYTNEYIQKIYKDHKIVFISVFGNHIEIVKKLNPLDFIVVYNLLIKIDSFNSGLYSFLLYDGDVRGRTIRTMDPKSEIALQLREQIEYSYLLEGEPALDYQNFKFDQSPSQILSQSQIFDSSSEEDSQNNSLTFVTDNNNANVPNSQITASTPMANADEMNKIKTKQKKKKKDDRQNLTMMIEAALNESSLDQTVDLIDQIKCQHLNLTSFDREIIYRHFVATEITIDLDAKCLRSFKELLNYYRIKQEQKFRIAAKFHSFVFFNSPQLFDSVDNLRKCLVSVHCDTDQCDYQESFDRFIDECSSDYCVEDGEVILLSGDVFCSTMPSTSTSVLQQSSTQPNSRQRFDKLKCPQCSAQSCYLSADFSIILQDYDNQLFLTNLSGLESNRFLSCTTDDYCHVDSDICRKIAAIFKYLYHITNHNSPCSQKIFWSFCSRFNSEFGENEFRITDAQLMTNVVSCGVNTIGI